MGGLQGGGSFIFPIAQYPFKGPHLSVKKIEESPGVFAVICDFEGTYYLLDVDHSDNVKQAIQNHERRKCWKRYHKGLIRYVVLYTSKKPPEKREEIEEEIRKRYRSIPCPEIKS